MKVEEVMVNNVIALHRDVSAYDAVELMNKNRIGCLVVVNSEGVVGILTERDLLERVLAE